MTDTKYEAEISELEEREQMLQEVMTTQECQVWDSSWTHRNFHLPWFSLVDLSSMSWLTLWNTCKEDVLLVRGVNLVANCYLPHAFDLTQDFKLFVENGVDYQIGELRSPLMAWICIFINVYLILYRDSSFVLFLSLGNRHNATRHWKSSGKNGKVIGIKCYYFSL